MRAIATGLSDVGLQREHNEDSFIVLSECDLFIVADGMGGHRAGDVASRLATDSIAEFFRSTAQGAAPGRFHSAPTLPETATRWGRGIAGATRSSSSRSSSPRAQAAWAPPS